MKGSKMLIYKSCESRNIPEPTFDRTVAIMYRTRNDDEERPNPLVYWSIGDGIRSIIEIGLDCTTGSTEKITLVNSGRKRFTTEPYPIQIGPNQTEVGLPKFELNFWPEEYDWDTRYIRELYNFEIIVGCDYLSILFCDVQEPQSAVRMNRMLLILNSKKELIRIDFTELTPQEMKTIRSASNMSHTL